MRIALFHNLPAGGAKRSLYEQVVRLKKQGFYIDLYALSITKEEFLPIDKLVDRKIVVKVSPYLKNIRFFSAIFQKRAIWKAYKKMASLINNQNYDIVYAHHCHLTGIPIFLRFIKAPSVFYCHEPHFTVALERAIVKDLDYASSIGHWRKLYLRHSSEIDAKTAKYIKCILTNSYHEREHILRVWGLNSYVCYHGVDSEKFRPLGLSREDYIITVGTITPHKGFHFVTEALSCVSKDICPKLIIAGEKEELKTKQYLIKLAQQKDIECQIKVGITDEELIKLYNQALMLVYTPYLEPFGFVPLEAMACGIPVIAIKEGGVRETIEDGKTGFLLERDALQFAQTIEYLIKNPKIAEEMGKKAREAILQKWSWEKSVESLIRHFKAVVAK